MGVYNYCYFCDDFEKENIIVPHRKEKKIIYIYIYKKRDGFIFRNRNVSSISELSPQHW